jgi:predicted Zn finger-like uncharacterized protein
VITHCPSCHTHFRVHAEQLAARAGQVRCGKCNRVFDALEHLIEEVVPTGEPMATHEFASMRAVSAAAESRRKSTPAQAANVRAEILEPAIAESAAVDNETKEAGVGMSEAATPGPAAAPPPSIEFDAASASNAFDFGPFAAADSAPHARRWPWLLGALLLLLVLLAQAMYYYRSTIVALFPEAKPYAAALCANLSCDLPLPRRIDLISIEASDLQADTTNPNIMVLSATLKNRAIFDQQLPSLELTLTDAQDQAVVRRVLGPRDYVGKAVNTQAGFVANTEIAIKVFIEGSQVRATGYRLYLFFP